MCGTEILDVTGFPSAHRRPAHDRGAYAGSLEAEHLLALAGVDPAEHEEDVHAGILSRSAARAMVPLLVAALAACASLPQREPAPEALAPGAEAPAEEPAAAASALDLPPGWPPDSILRRMPDADVERTAGRLPDSVATLLPGRVRSAGAGPHPVERYLLWLPPGLERADREWPLLLYLHGRSLRGRDLERVKSYGIPAFLDRGWALPFIVVAPQLPPERGWDRPNELASLLEEILERYPVDRSRVYLTGFSMGADGAWLLALAHPEPFAAAVPVSAWTPDPERVDLEALRGLPMRVVHGTADHITPFERARSMVEAMRARDLDVRLTAVQGGGHGIVNDVYRDSGFYRWLLERRLPSRPAIGSATGDSPER